MKADTLKIKSFIVAEMKNSAGEVTFRHTYTNLVTAVGDQFYAARASGAAGAPAAVTGMKLGTGSTAPAKTGAGAALTTYLANSHQALNGAPTASGGTVSYVATWAAGKATSASPITELVLVNDALADATSPESATLARILTASDPIPAKGAGDALTITWNHVLLGT